MHWFRSLATLAIPLSVIAACDDDETVRPGDAASPRR